MSPGVVVRQTAGTPTELEEVGRICVEAYTAAGQIHNTSDPYSRVLADAQTRHRDAVVLVAVRDDAIVGTVTICSPGSACSEIAQAQETEFRFLAVEPAAWGTGVSDALVEACARVALEAGSDRLVLCVRDTNHTAQSLYARHGFTRLPDRDWQPAPQVRLWGFQRMVGPTGLEPMTSSL